MRFPESRLAHELLDGLYGIEIGASAHNSFGLAGSAYVDYTDDMHTDFKEEERSMCGWALPVDVVAQGDALPFADGALDYVISSHVLEHFFDPIATIQEWLRVIGPGGYCFMIVPHKDRTADKIHARTTLADLIARHVMPLDERSRPCALDHHSIWVTEDLVELCRYLRLDISHVRDVDDKAENGFIVVVRKPGELPERADRRTVTSPALDLGCGGKRLPGFLGIDKLPGPNVDLVADFARGALPFSDATVPAVYSSWAMQELDDVRPLLRDVLRVCKHGADVVLWMPYARSDGALRLDNRRAFVEDTWLPILAEVAEQGLGRFVFEEIRLVTRRADIEFLERREISIEEGVSHLHNIVHEMGVFLRGIAGLLLQSPWSGGKWLSTAARATRRAS